MANRRKVRAVELVNTTPQKEGVSFYYKRRTAPFRSTVFNNSQSPTVLSRRKGTKSSITYQTGGDGAFRPCTHDTEQYLLNPVPDVVQVTDPLPSDSLYAPGFGQTTGLVRANHARYYAQFLSAVASAGTPAGSIAWNSLGQRALDSMMPTFGGQNSLLNFVLELRDFRELATALGTKSLEWLGKLSALIGYKTGKTYLANLSRSYLTYSFAWEPLYRDLTGFVSTLWSFNQRFELLRRQANTDLQKHFSTLVTGTGFNEILYYDSGDVGPSGGTLGESLSRTRHKVVIGACEGVRYNATLRYRYPLPPEMVAFGGKLRAFLDSLGLSADPSIIWNAIPFSFVVDWVVNVGRWLSQMRIDNIRFQTQIRDFCHSAVITRTIRYDTDYCHGYYAGYYSYRVWTGFAPTDFCRKRTYIRNVGIPDFATSMQTSGLDWREFSLAGALASSGTRSKWR